MKQNKPDGRCATWTRWDRWHIRIPKLEDLQKIFELYRKSGAKTKSDFLRARLLDESFKVITEDESAEEYYHKLSNITARIQKIGILYMMKLWSSSTLIVAIAMAQRMISKLEPALNHPPDNKSKPCNWQKILNKRWAESS